MLSNKIINIFLKAYVTRRFDIGNQLGLLKLSNPLSFEHSLKGFLTTAGIDPGFMPLQHFVFTTRPSRLHLL
jgi:hypothetical protein